MSNFPIFFNLRSTLRSIFSPSALFFHFLACALTLVVVLSGFEWAYYLFIQNFPYAHYVSPAVVIGGAVPVFGLPLLYLYSRISKNTKALLLTWTLSQAAMLGWAISSTYKAFTGRVQPPRGDLATLVDSSHDWNFGFLEHGIFWGWPSSHTTVAFSMSFALIYLYPKNRVVRVLAFLYALYIGLGISTQIHWVSEFVAGAIIGTLIGIAVGKNFHKKV
mgnify:CR=1 FL=1